MFSVAPLNSHFNIPSYRRYMCIYMYIDKYVLFFFLLVRNIMEL